MKRIDLSKEALKSNHRIFKGYSVKLKTRVERIEQHFIVPWEMNHDNCKNPVTH